MEHDFPYDEPYQPEPTEWVRDLFKGASAEQIAEWRARKRAMQAKALFTPEKLLHYKNDPIAYASEILGITLTDVQKEIMRSVVDNRRTLVKAHHSLGKTHCMAILACWWYDTSPRSIVKITAPNWNQAKELTFKQIKLFRQERGLVGGQFGRILETGRIEDEDKVRRNYHFIQAINAESGEGIHGEHTAPILIIIEEGVGVRAEIWQAFDSLMSARECRSVVVGNPTNEATQFGNAANSGIWNVISASAFEHPNIVAGLKGVPYGEMPVPGAVDLQWVVEQLEADTEKIKDRTTPVEEEFDWVAMPEIEAALRYAEAMSETSEADRAQKLRSFADRGLPARPADLSQRWLYKPNANFQGRVLGEFPSVADEQVIPRAWVNAGHARDLANLRAGLSITLPLTLRMVPEVGVDPAHQGSDRSVIVVRYGSYVLSIQVIRQMDVVMVANAIRDTVLRVAAEFNIPYTQIPIKTDVTGGLGKGHVDILRRFTPAPFFVVSMNSSSKPYDKEQYVNRRSELWFASRERARQHRLNLMLIGDPKLREQATIELTTPQYSIDGSGRKVVEPKEKMKKRMGYSPDIADAVNLAYAGFDRRRREVKRDIKGSFE